MTLSSFAQSAGRAAVLFDRFGWHGAKLMRDKSAVKNGVVKYSFKGLPHPVFLRPHSSDYHTFIQIFLEDQYDYDLGYEPEVILDCGANIGLASVYYANRYPASKIIAIEPETNNFALLQKNVEGYKNVVCLQHGIWHRPANLAIVNPLAGNWAFVIKEVENREDGAISAVSIGDIIEKYNIDTIDILKIDIEGSEKEVFQFGPEKWLGKCKLIVIEFHDKMKKDTARSFFGAVNNREYVISIKGENVFCDMCSQNQTPAMPATG